MSTTEQKPKTRRWQWISAGVILLFIILVMVRVREIKHVPHQDITPWALNNAEVTQGTVARGFPVLATVTTKGEVTITGQISGTILKMGPREGVRVKKGTFLTRIDTRELQDNIAGLQAKLQAAKAEFQRHKNELAREEKLYQEGGSSQTSLEAHRTAAIAAQNNMRALKRQISAMQVRLQYGTVLAPADGIISARLREPGDVCLRGHPLYRMTVSKGARVRVRLPQSILEQITPGASLQLFHGNDTLVVKLNRIYPSVDALALGAAEADLSAPPFGLASGARVAGRVILKERKNALQVPPDAIITGEKTGQSKVFKIVNKNNQSFLKSVPVIVSLAGKNSVAVNGSLSAGDRVVVAHESILLKLKDGDPVIVNEGGTL